MPTAIFLRAVNVGGTMVFRPAQLVKPLAHLGFVNIGAAGTFVVKERLSDAAIRAELMAHLPEGAEAFFAKGSEIASLIAKPPFPAKPFPDEHSRYITIFAKAPPRVKLPRDYPPGKDWECRVHAIQGRFLSMIRRRHSDPGTFPLKQLEKEFGARGTTRNWNTIMKVAAALVSCVLLAVAPLTAQHHSPADVKIVTSDIDHFWTAYDHLATATSHQDSLRVIRSDYFDHGSPGLTDFIHARIKSDSDLVAVIRRMPGYYKALRPATDRVKAIAPDIAALFARWKELYPGAVFPDVYFLIGRLNSGGTTSRDKILIGTEIYGRTAETPVGELSNWLRAVTRGPDSIGLVVAHELIHVNQQSEGNSKTLLEAALREGSADFLGELISGGNFNAHINAWAMPREKELWEEFSKEMNGSDFSHWLYQGDAAGKDRPADLGYFIGYRITQAYYQNHPDHRKAIRVILGFLDAEAFLKESGYTREMQGNLRDQSGVQDPYSTRDPPMSIRPVKRIITAKPALEGAGVHLRRAFGFGDTSEFDPFLLLDDFRNDVPADYMAGFPWHPHRGIETITYVLAGDVEHADSMGNRGTIGAGDVQWMTAGRGIVHQEMPKGDPQGRMHGFQLWANLPASRKMTDPRYQEIKAGDIPVRTDDDGTVARLVTGEMWGMRGPVEGIAADPVYVDISVPPGKRKRIPVETARHAFAYVFDGSGTFSNASDPQGVPTEDMRTDTQRLSRAGDRSLVLFDRGDEVTVQAGDEGIRFLLVSGQPLREPVAWYGPIVMNTQAELQTAMKELQEGTFLK